MKFVTKKPATEFRTLKRIFIYLNTKMKTEFRVILKYTQFVLTNSH